MSCGITNEWSLWLPRYRERGERLPFEKKKNPSYNIEHLSLLANKIFKWYSFILRGRCNNVNTFYVFFEINFLSICRQIRNIVYCVMNLIYNLMYVILTFKIISCLQLSFDWDLWRETIPTANWYGAGIDSIVCAYIKNLKRWIPRIATILRFKYN